MGNHLQEREHYENRYDLITVESCRRREQFFLEQGNPDGDIHDRMKNRVAEVGWAIEKVQITLHWYNDKDSTINKWMEEDRARDNMLAVGCAPSRLHCRDCSSELSEDSRTTWDREGKEEVLFFMKCPSGHMPMKGVFADGIELKLDTKCCPECNGCLNAKKLPGEKSELKTEYSCDSCDYIAIDNFSLSTKEKEEDSEYEKDRVRFCLSGDSLKEAQESQRSMENMKKLVDEWKHEEEHKEEYDAVKKLNKLTIPQVKEHITSILEDNSYLNVTFEKPSVEKFVSVEFSVEELETDNERSSTSKLQKLIKISLADTSWRLMSDGVSYRLGMMTGRLRAYESKEDLLKLVE